MKMDLVLRINGKRIVDCVAQQLTADEVMDTKWPRR
jgi:hypothetical protein